MGKKKKRQRDSWDLTAEEQMELADAFYEAEKKGKLPEFDKDGNISKFTKNGLEPGIEELIHQRLVESERKKGENLTNIVNDDMVKNASDVQLDDESQTKSYNDFVDELSKNKSAVVDNDDEEECEATFNASMVVNKIKFTFIEELNRLIVDDMVSPTSTSIDYVHSTTIKDMEYDDDYTGNTVMLLYYYILSTKHPYMILTKDEFIDIFKNVASYDTRDITLMEINDKYVAIYLVDKYTNEVLLDKIPEIYEFNNKEMIQYMLTLAINSGSIHDTFFYDQESYIEKLIEYQARYVDVDDFKEYLNDNGTEFSKDIPERTFDKLAEDLVILDFETLKSQAIETIEEILDESDEDEEDDDEEKEYEDTEESIEEEIDDLDEENEDFDDLLDSDDEEEE